MDMATTAVTIVWVITAKVCALLALWLRLRWRVRHEQVLRGYLTSIAEAAAVSGQFELDDQRGSGQRTRVKITRAPAAKENRIA